MNKPYSIGLDIGTNSVGWAVIDEQCSLVRYKHQNMSGSHLFSEAQKANERRVFRSTRRRMARRKRRIDQLQMLMDELVSQKDSAFFRRLRASGLLVEDKNRNEDKKDTEALTEALTSRNILFNDPDFTDKNYRAQYPTIYHLRKDLVESSDQRDTRLIYLALHHIIKYRGHFLYEGQRFDQGQAKEQVVSDSLLQLEELLGAEGLAARSKQVTEILVRTDISSSQKARELREVFNSYSNEESIEEIIAELSKLMVGLSAKVSKLGDVDYAENSFSFADKDYEDKKREQLSHAFGDDFSMIEAAESIYKWSLLQSVLKNKQYISQAMVASYDDYAQDLKVLKKLYREHKSSKEYIAFFRRAGVNYNAYEDRGSVKLNDLVAAIKKSFEDNPRARSTAEYRRFEERAALGVFLQKQRTISNGAIPHQIHRSELEAIIDNQSAYYPQLRELKDKLVGLLTFRIPYYVGPLKTIKGGFAWSVKKPNSDQHIFPWNFDQIIDIDQSAEKFIGKMRNFCTYIPSEAVLPKASLLYAEFELRNELQSVWVNDTHLSIDIQNRLVNELFANQKTVSHTALQKWLKANGLYDKADITGTQKQTAFASSLAAVNDFKEIGLDVTANRAVAEQIIEWVTLFEDKKILQRKLATLGDVLTPEQQERCLKLRYDGWGRLSRQLLDGIRLECRYGNCTVMDIMRQVDNAHFMRVIDSDDYPFKAYIAERQHEFWGDKTNISYEDVHSLAGSPGIKRGIWRSIRIVNEITELMGYAPKAITIEMARQEDAKKPTDSRQKNLLKYYDTCIELADAYNKAQAQALKQTLSNQTDKALRSERLYLYFLQTGKCAYSGQPLDIARLSDYDVDHIIPRTLLKDDSINNKVLVKQGYNRNKSSDYPLHPDIVKQMRSTWQMWRSAKLMDDAKFRRLIRQRELDASEVAGFISRQLVETRQISKHVVRLLSEQFSNEKTQIRTIRAGVINEYRHVYALPKSRDLNDFHHAKDAYLAAVIGEFMARRYPTMDKASLYNSYERYCKKRTSSLDPMFVVAEMGRDSIDTKTGEYRWLASDMVAGIERVMGYNDVLVTKMTEENTGEFYDQQAKPKGKGKIPIKQGLGPEKYGGYMNENCAYCVAVEWQDGKKTKRQLLGLPVLYAMNAKRDPSVVMKYVIDKLGEQSSPKILLAKIPLNQKIVRGGSVQYVASASEAHNAKPLVLPLDIQRQLVPILRQRSGKVISPEQQQILDTFFDTYVEKLENHYPMYASEAKRLRAAKNAFLSLAAEEKIDTIKKLLILSGIGAGEPDLHTPVSLNLAKRFGRKSGQTFHLDDVEFVYESITGLRKRVVKGKSLH